MGPTSPWPKKGAQIQIKRAHLKSPALLFYPFFHENALFTIKPIYKINEFNG